MHCALRDIDTAKNPETVAFVEAYHADLADDDDFAHMQQDEMTLADEGADEVEQSEEAVTAATLREQLREVSRQKAVSDTNQTSNIILMPRVQAHRVFNPDDVSWLDDVDDDEAINVKEIDLHMKDQHQPEDWDAHAQVTYLPSPAYC